MEAAVGNSSRHCDPSIRTDTRGNYDVHEVLPFGKHAVEQTAGSAEVTNDELGRPDDTGDVVIMAETRLFDRKLRILPWHVARRNKMQDLSQLAKTLQARSIFNPAKVETQGGCITSVPKAKRALSIQRPKKVESPMRPKSREKRISSQDSLQTLEAAASGSRANFRSPTRLR
jgi:hypothetical protein